jgi:hypothetical protein
MFLFWSKQDQRRFVDAVEKFHALVNDLETVLAPAKRRRKLNDCPAAIDRDKVGSSSTARV